MSKLTFVFSAWVMLASVIHLAGCNRGAEQPQTATEGTEQSDEGGADSSDIQRALAQLPPADRALAEKQKTCPVSEELLGSMGKPIKVSVEGRDVFLCCKGCEKILRENPDEYLAKLDDANP